jgi:hypothetical protein
MTNRRLDHAPRSSCLFYVLDKDGKAVPEADVTKWAQFMSSEGRIVQQNALPDGTAISTVFLGLDHHCGGRGPPVLWETKIFGGPRDGYDERYSSLEAAHAGHQRALSLASRKRS